MDSYIYDLAYRHLSRVFRVVALFVDKKKKHVQPQAGENRTVWYSAPKYKL